MAKVMKSWSPLFSSPSLMQVEQICGHKAHLHKLSGLYILWWHNSCPKRLLFWLEAFLSTSHTKPFVFRGTRRDKPRRHLTKWCKCTIVNNDTRHYTSVGLYYGKYTSVGLCFEKYTSVVLYLEKYTKPPSHLTKWYKCFFFSGKVQVYKCTCVLFETQVSTMIQDTAPEARTNSFSKKIKASEEKKTKFDMFSRLFWYKSWSFISCIPSDEVGGQHRNNLGSLQIENIELLSRWVYTTP